MYAYEQCFLCLSHHADIWIEAASFLEQSSKIVSEKGVSFSSSLPKFCETAHLWLIFANCFFFRIRTQRDCSQTKQLLCTSALYKIRWRTVCSCISLMPTLKRFVRSLYNVLFSNSCSPAPMLVLVQCCCSFVFCRVEWSTIKFTTSTRKSRSTKTSNQLLCVQHNSKKYLNILLQITALFSPCRRSFSTWSSRVVLKASRLRVLCSSWREKMRERPTTSTSPLHSWSTFAVKYVHACSDLFLNWKSKFFNV